MPHSLKLFVCVYSCQSDLDHLASLESTDFYKRLRDDPSVQLYRVFAGSESLKVCHSSNSIHLPCDESYDKLSLKTFNMIKFSLRFEYDYLVKVDSTLASYHLKQHSKNAAMLKKLSPAHALSRLYDPEFFCVPYNGLVMQSATKEGVDNWAKQKLLSCSYRDVFGDRPITPSYYLGKLYALRRDLCEYIAREGITMALEHVSYLGGAEDLMIGRLYERWRQLESHE